MEHYLIFFTLVMVLGIAAQWLAWRLRLPSILALLAFGFIAGQVYDQSQLINDDALFAIVSLSVALILLEGGLTLKFNELREAGFTVLRLSSLGALITWVLAMPALHYLSGFSWQVSALLGAILTVTGPTVIGPLLRNVRPRKPVDAILKWEGIVIDPVGAVLAVLVFAAVFGHGDGHSGGWQAVLIGLGKTLLVGFGFGYGAAKAVVFVLKRHWIPDYLHSVVVLAVGLGLFTVSNLIQHESGLLMITVLGVGIANQPHAPIRHIVEFKETLRVILISCLFIVLGGRVGWEEIAANGQSSLLLLLALIVVIRPASIFLSTIGSRLNVREKVFLSLMAPRGIVAAAVASIFAIELADTQLAFVAEAERIVPVIFTVIVGTVLFYGLTAAPIARKLGLAVPNPQGVIFAGVSDWVVAASKAIQEAGFRVLVIDSNYEATKKVRMAGVPSLTASVTSDYVTEEVDFSGLGRLVAVTTNDQVNSLACIGFSHALGRSNVFQLKPVDRDETERKSFSSELTGRQLFNGHVTSVTLREMQLVGAVVKVTQIKEEYSIEDFRKHYGENAINLFIIREDGRLDVVVEETAKPGVGDRVVSYVVEPAGQLDEWEEREKEKEIEKVKTELEGR